MINRYDFKKIISENPEEAHHIIADKLNQEAIVALFALLLSTNLVLAVVGIYIITKVI